MGAKDKHKVSIYKREIIRLFLTIYINHIKKSLKLTEIPHHESRYYLTQKQGSYENYELSVSLGDKNYTRIISIRLLAEGSGAKSIVFEVIYDIHIVIKIPPQKITDFSKYLRKVMHEKSVVDCLENKVVTIVPEFQCILKKIYPLDEKIGYDQNSRIEDIYIQLLKKNKNLHRFLQLDSGYVFFMYLSRNKTLGDFIRVIFNETEMVEKEIRENEGIFWDSRSFQGRYDAKERIDGGEDEEIDGIFLKYNEAFEFIDSYLKSVIRSEYRISIETYQTRQWFLEYLSSQTIDIDETIFPKGFLKTLTIAYKYIFHNYSDTFEKFFQLIREHAEQRRYTFNKEKLRIVCSNFLVMLTLLFKKGVAHRDLKPDNIIIVAKNFERSQMVQSEIGLIDFETAYAIDLQDNIEVAGGTPQYAMLSQLFQSHILEAIYGPQYKTIYPYQDLYAALGIIYQLYTGKTLFSKTSTVFKEAFKELTNDNSSISEDGYIRLAKRFWKSACTEFNAKLKHEEKILKSFHVRMNAEAMRDFLDVFFPLTFIEQKLGKLNGKLQMAFKTQKVFDEEQIKRIQSSDSERLLALIDRNEAKGLHDHIQFLRQILGVHERIELFNSIRQLKRDVEHYLKMRAELRRDDIDKEELDIMKIQVAKQKESIEERSGVKVYDLLQVFFEMTFEINYLREWGPF